MLILHDLPLHCYQTQLQKIDQNSLSASSDPFSLEVSRTIVVSVHNCCYFLSYLSTVRKFATTLKTTPRLTILTQRQLNSVKTLLIDIVSSSDWEWLPSQTITVLMVGLCVAFCWAHNRPMWINFMISLLGFSINKGSIITSGLPSANLFRAWPKKKKEYIFSFRF